MEENIKSNRIIWIVGINAVLFMCAILACAVIYAVTVTYNKEMIDASALAQFRA